MASAAWPSRFGAMKIWGLSVLFVASGLLAQEEERVMTAESWQPVADQDIVFPDWLQAQRDPFLQRAIFDFGQAFFRIRGMDARYTEQRLNGFPMNSLYNGRPEWQQWAGLNDVTRNERYSLGIQLFEQGFGGLQGARAIWVQPSALNQGTRLTLSETNRSYRHRALVTHAGPMGGDWFLACSFSRRWADEGRIHGSPYTAWAGFLGLEYRPKPEVSLMLSAMYNANERIRMPALTEEVYRLKGNRYNPWWGLWDRDKRVANLREFQAPLIMVHFESAGRPFSMQSGLSYQDSRSGRDRLGYYNASNPDPTYYRYLPSFYLNSPLGADYLGANAARNAIIRSGQLNWEHLVRANTNPLLGGKASYSVHTDQRDTRRWTGYISGKIERGKSSFTTGGYGLIEENRMYARIMDLLGAEYHEDIDPFSETHNDLDGTLQKQEGDTFGYDYLLSGSQVSFFGQWRWQSKKWQFHTGGNWLRTQMHRDGRFRNARFPKGSFGKSEKLSFDGYGAKTGLRFSPNGRHQIAFLCLYHQMPPTMRNAFINPREHNRTVSQTAIETLFGLELNYRFRLPRTTGRISTFHNRIGNRTEIRSFYVDSGLGSDFVQEVATGIDLDFKGVELALKHQLSADVSMDFAASIGEYTYANDPQIDIYFDPAEWPSGSGVINTTLDLGASGMEGYHVGQGPETAVAIGLTYNDPKYWWAGLSLDYMSGRYVRPAYITRTASFLLDPDTGDMFPDADPLEVDRLLRQQKLPPIYLLNLIGGKSWKLDDKYLSLFLSCSNFFDLDFATGGYEQSRNGNFGQMLRDNQSGNPSFGPKLWYNQGRVFFVNLSLRL